MKTIPLMFIFLLLAMVLCSQHKAYGQNLTYQDILKLPSAPADRRVAYGRDPLQFGEIRLPPGRGPHPVAVIIHGGCWYAEYDLNHIASFAEALTRLGVATWVIEYRRIGNTGGGWPGTLEDVAQATDYLRTLARVYSLDLRRVVAVGHSAGGQLALWLATRDTLPRESPLHSGYPLRLRGVISLAGITDMQKFGSRCGGAARKLLGGSREEIPERYKQSSPIELLTRGTPLRLIHGALDQIVPLEFGEEYEMAAKSKGLDIELIVLKDAGHFDLIAPQSAAGLTVQAVVLSLLRPTN